MNNSSPILRMLPAAKAIWCQTSGGSGRVWDWELRMQIQAAHWSWWRRETLKEEGDLWRSPDQGGSIAWQLQPHHDSACHVTFTSAKCNYFNHNLERTRQQCMPKNSSRPYRARAIKTARLFLSQLFFMFDKSSFHRGAELTDSISVMSGWSAPPRPLRPGDLCTRSPSRWVSNTVFSVGYSRVALTRGCWRN